MLTQPRPSHWTTFTSVCHVRPCVRDTGAVLRDSVCVRMGMKVSVYVTFIYHCLVLLCVWVGIGQELLL